jgi:hypothetical protein
MTGLNVSHAGRPDGKTNRRVTYAVALVGYPSPNSYFYLPLKFLSTAKALLPISWLLGQFSDDSFEYLEHLAMTGSAQSIRRVRLVLLMTG